MTRVFDSEVSEDRFSRLRLISWWNQEKIAKCRLLVVGAGALGNEILKNAALLGFTQVVVVDLDRIEESNLSRAVLYRSEDAGKFKADAAASAYRSLAPDASVHPLVANVVHGCGLGLFEWSDVIVAGLDNREARLWINRSAWKVNRPWIDGAIEGINGVARVFLPGIAPCYECTLGEVDWALLEKRMSCNLLVLEQTVEGKIPTTPTISSIIAGVQVQEAVKLIHGLPTLASKGYVFEGMNHSSYVVEYTQNADCMSHYTLQQIVHLRESSDDLTLAALRERARSDLGSPDVVIEFSRDVVQKFVCPACNEEEELYQPVGSEYNTKSPLNGLAAKWAAQNSNLLPIDPRPVAPPLIDASHVQAPQAAEAPAVAQPVAEVHAPVDEPWLERIVIPAGNPTIPAPDELKIEAAAGTDRADFGRWWKVILISAVLATLGGVLVWYVFHRQGKVAVGSAVDPSRRIRATAARRSSSFAELLRQSYTELPGSSDAGALRAEENARKLMQTKDYTPAITALKNVVSVDPNCSRAWIELGWAYTLTADKSSALNAFQKAVESDPKKILPYKILAFDYLFLGDRDHAIATWQRLQSIVPDDADIAVNLGGLYMAQKRYSEAGLLFETAAKANPSDAYAQLRLGMVRLRSRNTDQGLAALHKALEIDSGAEMLNDVAYEMAEADTHLGEALVYSQQSVKEVEERSQKVDLENIQKSDLRLPFTIAAYWDTMGWIYFKMDDLAVAESYLDSSWRLAQDGVVGDHLGQLYEKEQKLPAALHMYMLALEANPRSEETAAHMGSLSHVPLPANRMSAGEELSRMRTVKLPAIVKETATADFDVLLVADGKVEEANFVRGSELLRLPGQRLKRTLFEEMFPPNSTAHLVRRGMLSCSKTSCSFVFYPASAAAATN